MIAVTPGSNNRQNQVILYYTLLNHEYISLPLVNYAKSHFGWTTLQFSSIAYLKRFGKLSMSDLARHLFVSKQQATQLVTSLVKHGLATRIQSETNRRIIFVSATPIAVRRLQEAEDAFIANVRQQLNTCPEKEKAEVVKAMETMIAFTRDHGEEMLGVDLPPALYL